MVHCSIALQSIDTLAHKGKRNRAEERMINTFTGSLNPPQSMNLMRWASLPVYPMQETYPLRNHFINYYDSFICDTVLLLFGTDAENSHWGIPTIQLLNGIPRNTNQHTYLICNINRVCLELLKYCIVGYQNESEVHVRQHRLYLVSATYSLIAPRRVFEWITQRATETTANTTETTAI